MLLRLSSLTERILFSCDCLALATGVLDRAVHDLAILSTHSVCSAAGLDLPLEVLDPFLRTVDLGR